VSEMISFGAGVNSVAMTTLLGCLVALSWYGDNCYGAIEIPQSGGFLLREL